MTSNMQLSWNFIYMNKIKVVAQPIAKLPRYLKFLCPAYLQIFRIFFFQHTILTSKHISLKTRGKLFCKCSVCGVTWKWNLGSKCARKVLEVLYSIITVPRNQLYFASCSSVGLWKYLMSNLLSLKCDCIKDSQLRF